MMKQEDNGKDTIENLMRLYAGEFFESELSDLISQKSEIQETIDNLKTKLDFLNNLVPSDIDDDQVEVNQEEAVSEETVPEDNVIEEVVAEEEPEASAETNEEASEVEEAAVEPAEEVEYVEPEETPESLGLVKTVFSPEKGESEEITSEEEIVKEEDSVLDSSNETEV
jgi:hypothetical protein